MDMPGDCPLCPVAHYNQLGDFTGCDMVGSKRYAMSTEEGYKELPGRPKWCPLKPMPLRRMHECVIVAEDKEYMRTNAFTDYDKGWNACLDEIEGKEE